MYCSSHLAQEDDLLVSSLRYSATQDVKTWRATNTGACRTATRPHRAAPSEAQPQRNFQVKQEIPE